MANYDIGDALHRIELLLLASMRRNLKRHLHEEQDEGFRWSMWQAEQLTDLGNWTRRNYRQYASQFTKINQAAIGLLQQSAERAALVEEDLILRTGIQRAAGFFNAPEDKLSALTNAVRHDLSQAEHSILRQADDLYRQTLFDAHMYLQTGSGTLNNAIDTAVQDLMQRGIRSVAYRNGHRVEASVYARMALRSANVRAKLTGEGAARDRFGVHTVIVSPSGIACEKCAPWMGQILVDDVYCSGSHEEAAELGVPLLSEAVSSGLLHPQCNCAVHTFQPGISKLPEVTDADREQAVNRYRLTQQQRYNERQIRRWKYAEDAAPDEAAKKAAHAKVKAWQQTNKALCDAHPDELRRDYQREKIWDAPRNPVVPEVIEKEPPEEKVAVQARPEQEAITIPPPDGHTQNYRPTITNPSDSVEIPRPSSPAAFRAETTQNVIYISENVTLKPKKLHQIDRRITEALRLIGMSGASVSPRIVVVSREDMGNNDPGSYRAVEDLLLLCEDTAVYSPDSVPELMAQLACGDNDLSTYIHELYHWREAVRYRRSSGEITHEDYTLYSQRINDRAKKALDILVEKGYNVIVSDYARRSAIKGLFDEVFTEYRTYQVLGGDRDA